MWKLFLLAAAFAVPASPVDAKESVEKSPRAGELRRDIERISKEIYRPRSDLTSPGRSFAAGAATKKR
jgi:hypothetical protein